MLTMTRLMLRVMVLLAVLVLSFDTAGAQEVLIIGHPDLAGVTLDVDGLQRIYLGKQTRWDNDDAIVPVMLKTGPVHDEFVEKYLGRSVYRFVTYWRQMVFTGKGIPPKGFVSEEELVGFVAATPGALGYVSSVTDVDAVKVIVLPEGK